MTNASDRPELPASGGNGEELREARETARIRAGELRAEQRKRDLRRRWGIRGGVALGILLVFGIVAAVLLTFVRPPGGGPRNMLSDGIRLTTGLEAIETRGLRPGQAPVQAESNPDGVIDIRLWVDYLSPESAAFERANSEQLQAWLASGSATLEIHPIALPTRSSGTTQQSVRAANAAACVADLDPGAFFAFHDELLASAPGEGDPALEDAGLADIARDAGVSRITAVRGCIDDRRFVPWVQDATARVVNGPVPGTDLDSISATPVVLMDGAEFRSADPADPEELARFFVQASGGSFTEDPTPTPTPSPSPTG